METLLLLIAITFFASLFWHSRKQAETAKQVIERRCNELNLQLISVARGRTHLRHTSGYIWVVEYQFEFSSDTENSYRGSLFMNGMHALSFDIPAYRI